MGLGNLTSKLETRQRKKDYTCESSGRPYFQVMFDFKFFFYFFFSGVNVGFGGGWKRKRVNLFFESSRHLVQLEQVRSGHIRIYSQFYWVSIQSSLSVKDFNIKIQKLTCIPRWNFQLWEKFNFYLELMSSFDKEKLMTKVVPRTEGRHLSS